MPEIDSELELALNYLEHNKDESLKRLFDILKIPSISTQEKYSKDCLNAANWFVEQLKDIGFDASIRETNGHPMVVAHFEQEGPHFLFYGHYDVQPIDPIELWNHDPFEPKIEKSHNGEIIKARGASDDKGQVMTFIEACRAHIKTSGTLPCKISILLEGEEEIGSPSMSKFLKDNKKELSADYCLVCDTGMWDYKTPCITTMLRGMVGDEIKITAANRDLHSGMYGGLATNPIHVLSNILSLLYDKDGRITLEGFYDDVPELSNEQKEQWESLNFDAKEFLSNVGLSNIIGEKDYSPLEKIWSRPTCEVNGIWGGYTEPGFKTVLPSEASAKVSFRLVGEQDPDKVLKSFRNHVSKNLPSDCKVEFLAKAGSGASSLEINSLEVKAAEKALHDEWNVSPKMVGCGGSIPIGDHFKNILGTNSLLVGFGLDDDKIHSPNEKYNLSSYQKGARSWARIIFNLSKI